MLIVGFITVGVLDKSDRHSSAAPAKATPGANTDALVKVELALWEAWKAKDARKLDELTAKDLSFVNIFGTSFATKADAMQDWTGGNCEVKSVSVTDGFATALSPTVEMLTRKGTADGTCAGIFGSRLPPPPGKIVPPSTRWVCQERSLPPADMSLSEPRSRTAATPSAT